jgi:hypothetical protein
LTIFIFTEKARKILGEPQGDIFFAGVIILACVAYLLYIAFFITHKQKRPLNVIVVVIFLFFFGSRISDEARNQQYLDDVYAQLTRVYQNKEYKIVEGRVSVLHEEPEGGHDSGDIIKIDGIAFELSCFRTTFGYNKTIVYGGVLTEGTFARVFYYQTEDQSNRSRIILRIDLLEPANIPAKRIDPLLPCAG